MTLVMPAHVFVIGGGRWARVYLDALCGLLPAVTSISVHTVRGGEAMTGWVAEKGLGHRIVVMADAPQPRAHAVAVVANAAADHVAAAMQAMECCIPVLLEKPLAPTFSEASRLVESAQARGTVLASSQVFLFARYMENFCARQRAAGRPMSLALNWVDPKSEIRHGEAKRFDASLPIQADILPHVVPLIALLTGALPEVTGAQRSRDRLVMDMALMANGIPCQLHLERAGASRSRTIMVVTENGPVQLDFSREPGTIWQDGTSIDADPDWTRAPRPLTRMLAAFFSLALVGTPDERSNTTAALKAISLSDFAESHADFRI